ncbi:MAG: translocation/assembly module TamB domain-containing protein [Flavobacteriaceae bacterium]|nr:translocation/assembly module TamB domain-containing protein [Candidatus Onthonaster equi]
MIVIVFSLRIPAVQNFVKDRLVIYLEEKIKTDVELERVYVDFPNSLVMENLYLQGEDVDTLLFAKKLDVGLNILQLINNKADLTSIDLNTARANVVRRKDGSFNFDYIVNAFVTEEKEATESKPFIISLDKIKLQKIGVSFIDQQAGNNINVYINTFDTRVKKFDLQQNSYAIDKIALDGLKLRLKQDLVQEIANKVEEKVDSLNQQKPMQLALGEIDLKNFDVDYGDDNTQMYANLKFSNLTTSIRKIDLQQNDFAIGDIDLEGLKLKFNQKLVKDIQDASNSSSNKSTSTPLKIALNKINLKNIAIDYGDDRSKTYAKLNLNELRTKINSIDLANNNFDIDDVLLKDATIDAKLFLKSNSNSSTTTSTPLQIALGKGIVENVKINYDNTAEKTSQGLDYNHLNIEKLALDLRDFKMVNGEFAGKVNNAELKEKKGFHVQKLKTNFLYGSQQAYLKDLYVQTPRTIIRDEIIVNYRSISELTNNIGNVTINADLNKSKISFADILFLVPTLRETTPFKEYPNATLAVDTELYGLVNDLNIKHLSLSGLDDLKVNASGRVQNAMDTDRLAYDLNIKNLSTSSKTIYKLVPKNTIPTNIRIPSQLALKGKVKGTLSVINPDLYLTSSLGNAAVKGNLDIRKTNAEKYNLNAQFDRLDIGTIISNKQLGKITGDVNIKGQSFDLAQANTSIKGKIKQAYFNNYNYQNITLDGSINQGYFNAKINSEDKNADLNLVASGIYKNDLSDVKIDGQITKIDLNKIGFYNNPMIIAGEINGNFESLNIDQPNGALTLKNFALSDEKEIFPIQEMSLVAISTADSNKINLKSQIADAEIKGKFKLTEIGASFMETMNGYYAFQKTPTIQKIEPNQYFTFNAKIKDDDLIRKFLPDLKEFETINLNGNYTADTQKLNIVGEIPLIIYGENIVRNGVLNISNPNESINYNLSVNELQNASFKLKNIDLGGTIANNIIAIEAISRDEQQKEQFLVSGEVEIVDNHTSVRLKPNGLTLNYDNWTVADDNELKILSDGFIANNFRISNNGSEILVNSETNNVASPINITISNFEIQTITELIKKDDLPASGVINGTAQIKNITKDLAFEADFKVTDLQAFNNPVGNLTLTAKNVSPTLINANIALTGYDNDLKIYGDYDTKASAFNLDFDINSLQMKTIQGFTQNMITDTEGYLAGKLDVNGTLDAPKIIGQIKFNDVGLTLAEYGSNFRNINDGIDFTNKGIEFNRFKINDNDGNSLTLDGDILTKTYRDFSFDLKVNARDFKVINSEKTSDAITYGVLAINANLTIGGDLDLPVVNGQLKVTENTDFTFVLPQTSPALQDREGIVEFIDQDQIALQETIKTEELSNETKVKGFNVSVNIELDREAKTSIIIDKANGDFVELQGEAQLTGGMDPSGKISLTGVYEVEKGAYELSVSLIKRRFDIQKGSTITWTGEPTTANLDITAVYTTQAAPIDLVEQQLAGLSSGETNMFKQRIPFNTNLILKGELLKPEISFDIKLNEDNPSVSSTVIESTNAKLTQLRTDEAEMNKQVFALLLLNRFIGENPFQSQSGVSAETLAKQSVSNILSQQLNNLASDLIQGVDIDFGLDTQDDYTTGSKNTRTDLNVAVSKRLLDDRLKVSIGSNFGLEGDARQNENMTNIAGDITAEYSLSRDGRYMLRAYRKDEYQVALQGQIVETGVGFIITLDYDKFKEIFEKRRKNRNFRRTPKVETKP